MPKFNLPKDTLSRLKAQFSLFAAGRERVRGLVDGYVIDYRSYKGFPADKEHYSFYV